MLVAGLSVLVACGLDVLATGDGAGPGGPDATSDGSGDARSDASLGDGSPIELPPDPVLDGGLDVNQANCLAACDGGSCDAGWCVLACGTQNACTSSRVDCPPGIPCEVHCTGEGSCTQGVDCTGASACRIDCSGSGSCTTKPVQCSGLGCKVDCLGKGSCTSGVDCDAGACAIACLGEGTCTTSPITCNANTCSVRCGVGGEVGKDSCTQGVKCDTTQLCDIRCAAHDVCRNQPISARSDGTSSVQCTGETTCNKGSILSGGEAGVLCSGNGSCETRTFCDAGKCTAWCENENIAFCCKGDAVVCERRTKNCAITASGCP